MKVLHGTWIPNNEQAFIQKGAFYIWVEDVSEKYLTTKKKENHLIHKMALSDKDLSLFLKNNLGIKYSFIKSIYFLLPSIDKLPLYSYKAMKYLAIDPPIKYELNYYQIPCFEVSDIIKTINDIHFLSIYNDEIQLGSDFLFWYNYSQRLKEVIINDLYIPALKYREINEKEYEIYPFWEIISEKYESNLKKYVDSMPYICLAGSELLELDKKLYSQESLLRHFSECHLYNIISYTKFSAKMEKQLSGSFVYGCIRPYKNEFPWTANIMLDIYKQWSLWKEEILSHYYDTLFVLCFQLIDANLDDENSWQIKFLVASKKDPSLRIDLSSYWNLSKKNKKMFYKEFGDDFEKKLLINLGFAAKMYPKLWSSLNTDKPMALTLTMDETYNFLKEGSWLLEYSGFKVIVPYWWTEKGRKQAKVRLQTKAKMSTGSSSSNKSHFTLESIAEFQYQLSIGDHIVSEKEWMNLVNSKTPLVNFRGEWIELDREKMKEMLELWKSRFDNNNELSMIDIIKLSSESQEDLDFDHDKTLSEIFSKINHKAKFELIDNPKEFQGILRDYQRSGVSWLNFLENLGLNPCLADDMGLGKTIQIIARLLIERSNNKKISPTLLIAPTSVLGNWKKELERFAPSLKSLIHHGINRISDEKMFIKDYVNHDVIISSYNLIRKDINIFSSVEWQRIVVDEAQNIKNPNAKQTKAILKLKSKNRIALTGTPIENRLLDLWSIFNFLNPGYLGKESQFKKNFEIPIQKDNNLNKSNILKKLVEPFILRRVKTDKNVIKDLPEKIEQKVYCNLTREQA
ncbi:MAG: DEAD/DEAH box helicase, partial [Spirochaetota bacterium]|nr:DEAD/DEAH box helicase [Spirochaetota bacterium]